jgi:hypothetical protein
MAQSKQSLTIKRWGFGFYAWHHQKLVRTSSDAPPEVVEPFALSVVSLQTMCPFDNFNTRPALEPDEFYHSEEGFIIFTSKYLTKRGYCCKNGCKHCPYGFDKSKGRIVPRK